jgi:hypothetical protein
MTSCELLTPEPIGEGPRFRAVMRGRTPMDIALTEFDRPRRLGSVAHDQPREEASGTITLSSDGVATVMWWDWQARSNGWLHLLGPLFGAAGAWSGGSGPHCVINSRRSRTAEDRAALAPPQQVAGDAVGDRLVDAVPHDAVSGSVERRVLNGRPQLRPRSVSGYELPGDRQARRSHAAVA